MKLKLFLTILLAILNILILIPLIHAQCLDAVLAKSSYLSGETFQAEITGNLIKPLAYNDIYFYYQGKEYFPAFSLEQIAANKWIVYTDLPQKFGINEFKINKLVCRENDSLKELSRSLSFTIKKPLQDYYSSLMNQAQTKLNILSSDELSQSIIALKDLNQSLVQESRTKLRQKGTDCWPSLACSVKSTVLAILALNSNESKNWLLNAQNAVSLGLWDLVTVSDSEKKCNLSINENKQEITIPSGTNSLALHFPDVALINISLDCNITAKISQTYLGTVHEFPLGVISNEKCFGNAYREKCNALSTAYALRVLEDETAKNYLSENALTTEEIAYAYRYTNSAEFENWLLNNQHPAGYWSNVSLILSNKSNVYATTAALNSLKENTKAESWLRDNLDTFTFEETALSLQYFSSKIEPLISLQKGLVKAKSSENIVITASNKGILPVNLKATLESAVVEKMIPAKSSAYLTLQVPVKDQITFSSIDLAYTLNENERGYSIPLIISPTAVKEETILEQTVEQAALKTANFNFIDKEINETLELNKEKQLQLKIQNLDKAEIKVALTAWGLSDIITQMPSSVTISPNSIASVNITLEAKSSLELIGQIIAEYQGNSASIPVYVKTLVVSSNQTCSSLNGKTCSLDSTCQGSIISAADGACCVGECKKTGQTTEEKKKSSSKLLGIIMIIVAILVVALVLFLKLKKPKKQSSLKNVLEKIKEESKAPSNFEFPKEKEVKD